LNKINIHTILNYVLLILLASILLYSSYYPQTQIVYPSEKTGTIMPYYVPVKYEKYVKQLCYIYYIPIDIFCRMISKESEWDEKCVSYNYDKALLAIGKKVILSWDGGLGQQNSYYVEKEFRYKHNNGEPINVFDGKTSLKIAAKMLSDGIRETGNLEGALQIYNCGLARYKTGDIPNSTIAYCKDILYNTNMRVKF